ncbi:MAG TPA: hypothetical protein VHD32_06955 [Candidatus Didemnitutus sp.]|nr:hypothetical protein [Candidatus Didemnitutus sp.]
MRPVSLLTLLALAVAPLAVAETPSAAPAGHYKNFNVAIYIPVAVVKHLAEPGVLESEWATISSQLKVDKVYIEPERDRVLADDATLEKVKSFFLAHGVRVAGGITFSDSAGNGIFRSFCYTDPADRAFVQSAAELTARHFDEIILDDFFFVTTKFESDIAAKGNRSWTDFRLDLMNDAGRKLVVEAAKKVNPRAKVTIKYPNWYEHFAGLGFDLQEGPKIFDGIYTGTETRDPNNTDQYLQQYESYEIIRYFENIAPGRNGGGWVDTYASLYVDRYAEQLWDTMFARAREMTLFNWALLVQPAAPGTREAWATKPTTFNYDAMVKYHPEGAGVAPAGPTMARVAGYALDQADAAVGHLGRPIGLRSYRPPHATGEDFLHNYIGMLGIPVEMQPTFPDDAPVVLLTEDAKGDPGIIDHIKRHLLAGKTVVVTSGFARAMQGHGLEQIVELETSGRHFLSDGYSAGFGPGNRAALANKVTGAPPILYPQIGFLTNDAWALVSGMSDGVGYPLLLLDRYGQDGRFYVWTVPDDFADLYRIPPAVITAVKNTLMEGFPVRIDGPNEVALFAYDNHTFIVESFRGEDADIHVATLGDSNHLTDLGTGQSIEGKPPAAVPGPWRRFVEPRHTFDVHLAPHSFRVFRIDP